VIEVTETSACEISPRPRVDSSQPACDPTSQPGPVASVYRYV
jgi:hypothetical protein